MRIGPREIGPGHPVFLQAEVGTTHNGDVKRALALVDAAADAGLDACKFIVTDPQKIGAQEAVYQYETAQGCITAPIGGLLARTMLTFEEWRQVRDRCRERGVIFYATADHGEAVDLLEALKVPCHKLSAWDITYYPLLLKMLRTGKPVIVEIGTATLREMENALDTPTVIPMNAPHPHEAHDWHLARTWPRRVWGFSSPGRSEWCDYIALGRETRLIEKRLTLDRFELAGHHHWISLDPEEMREWVEQIRLAETALTEDLEGGTAEAWAERAKWDRDPVTGLRHG